MNLLKLNLTMKNKRQQEIEPDELCYYPDRKRKKLQEKYYENGEIENKIIEEIKELISNYNFINKGN